MAGSLGLGEGSHKHKVFVKITVLARNEDLPVSGEKESVPLAPEGRWMNHEFEARPSRDWKVHGSWMSLKLPRNGNWEMEMEIRRLERMIAIQWKTRYRVVLVLSVHKIPVESFQFRVEAPLSTYYYLHTVHVLFTLQGKRCVEQAHSPSRRNHQMEVVEDAA